MNVWQDQQGSALVEIAFALPVLALILAGTVDYGLYTERKMQVVEAANAAASYGAVPGNQVDTTGMKAAAAAASPGLSGLTVTASSFWICSSTGSHVASSYTCPGLGTPVQYVQVTTSATISAPMPLMGVGSSFVVTGQSSCRVRWKPS